MALLFAFVEWKVYFHEPYSYSEFAETEVIIESFGEVVFRSDDGEDVDLERWNIPIRVHVDPSITGQHLKVIEETLPELSRLTGLTIYPAGRWSEPNWYVYRRGRPEMMRTILKHHDILWHAKNDPMDFHCAVFRHGLQRDRPTSAVIFIERRAWRPRTCIVEELAQALGVGGDFAAYEPTIYTDDYRTNRMSVNDKIILRALYDDRLEFGMTRDEAMPIVRQIIPELIEAMKERGVEALYQR